MTAKLRQKRWHCSKANIGLALLLFTELVVIFGEDTWESLDIIWALATILLIVITLQRRPAVSVSNGAVAIVVTSACYVLPYFFEIGELPRTASIWIPLGLATTGAVVQLWSVLTLRTSFSLLPAVRTLVQSGPYRFLRHPMYFSYLMTVAAVVAFTPSARNVGLAVIVYGVLSVRAILEEREFRHYSQEYEQYMAAIRFRFLPWPSRRRRAD